MSQSAILTFATFINVGGDGGNKDWGTLIRAQVSDNSYASVTLDSGFFEISRYLVGHTPLDTSAIPSNATILGFEVICEAKCTGTGTFNNVKLYQSGAIVGNSLANSEVLSSVDADYSFGGPDELGGVTWTRAQIDTMGVGIQTEPGAGTITCSVDFLRVRVYFTCRPSRAKGWQTRLIVQEEDSWGVPATSGHEALGIEESSESLRLQRQSASDGQHFLGQGRGADEGRLGNHNAGGDVVGLLQPHGIWPLFAKHALGSVSTSGSGPYCHTLNGADSLPTGLTLEKRFVTGGAHQILRYPGSKIDQLFFRWPGGSHVDTRARFVSKDELVPTTDLYASPTYATDNEPFTTVTGAVKADTDDSGTRESIAVVRRMELLIENQLDGTSYSLEDGAARSRIGEGGRIVRGSLNVMFTKESWEWYTAYRNDTVIGFDITVSRDSWSWQVIVPAAKVRGDPTPIVGNRGPVNLDLAFVAYERAGEDSDITMIIINNDATLSTAV